ASVEHLIVLRIGSSAVTRAMMKRVCRTISRIGATTCSGKIDAPSASGSIGLNVVWLSSLISRSSCPGGSLPSSTRASVVPAKPPPTMTIVWMSVAIVLSLPDVVPPRSLLAQLRCPHRGSNSRLGGGPSARMRLARSRLVVLRSDCLRRVKPFTRASKFRDACGTNSRNRGRPALFPTVAAGHPPATPHLGFGAECGGRTTDGPGSFSLKHTERAMFKGLTALVTGSTSGIGLGIATSLAANGANIVLNGFGDADAIEKLRVKLAAEHGVTVRYDGADLSKQEPIEKMMANALNEF